jgi:hypothetical protein
VEAGRRAGVTRDTGLVDLHQNRIAIAIQTTDRTAWVLPLVAPLPQLRRDAQNQVSRRSSVRSRDSRFMSLGQPAVARRPAPPPG